MTSRTGLENRPDTLWRLAGSLWSRVEEGERLPQGQLDAVVEAFFRIGVHPGTDPATALTLLARAHRLDGTNPKHPYHVGLLYLRHGRPEAAVRWLTAAASLSPVNHRVWAHLSLAYRGLDERQSGTPGYTGEHRARAEEIDTTIREGRDDFDPEAAETPLPLLRPGVCRWTGVHDMAADGRLRGRTAERTRDVLHADLEAVSALADQRRGGAASFTVLAVQWMVYGYPPATVRRLMKRLPPDDGPAGRLLSLVCDLFETDRDELPARLAACLAERSLPDVLVALIHRQRLFRRPLRFPDLGAHAAARAFTDGDPARHEKALAAAWRALGEEPPGPMADVPRQEGPEEVPAAGPDERLAVYADTAAVLRDLREDARARAKALGQEALNDGTDYARLSGDQGVLTELVDRLEAVRQSWVEELRRFKGAEPAGLVMPFADFQRQLEECEAEFQEPLGNMRNILKRGVERKLAKRRGEFAEVAPAPSPGALALSARLAGLEGRDPSAVVGSVPKPPRPDERLTAFEEVAARLTGLMNDALDRAKALTKDPVEDTAGLARAVGDQDVLTALVDRWELVRQARLEELRLFKGAEPEGLVMPFAEFQQRLETCEALLQQSPGSLRNQLNKRVGRKLAPLRQQFGAVAPEPSERARDLAARLTELEGQPSEAPSAAPAATAAPGSPPSGRRPTAPPPPPGDAGARDRVAHALAMAEEGLRANYTEARATLDAYPPRLRHREAVTLLRGYLGGQQAEAELRLGRATAARRHWNTMLTDDPLHSAVLRNLAVAHTSAGDLAHAGLAWRRCLEALYLRDLLHGDIRRGAAERAEVHRVLAGSFGTAPLVQGMTPRSELEEDAHRIPPVLAARSKVGTAVAHLRLDWLNHILTHRSPTLLLGVGRSVGEAELAAARDARRAAVATAVAALPARVREPFEQSCLRLIEEAHTEASRAKGRTRRAGDEAEEEAHLAWARGRVLWKLAINKAVVQDTEADWALTEYSGDVLGNLRLIDALPLDPTDESVLTGLRQVGYQGDPVPFVKQLNKLGELACERAVSRVFEAAGEAASGGSDRFCDRFRRIGRSWDRNSVPDRYIDLLNDLQGLYYPSVRSAFGILNASGAPTDEQQRNVVAAAVTAQERWVERLPGATGPAIVLAQLLGSLDRHDEAETVLNRADGEAFSERGRQKLALPFVRLAIDQGRYAEAVQRLRTLLLADPGDEEEKRIRGLLIDAYSRWINSGQNVPSVRTVAGDFSRWTDDNTVELRRKLVMGSAMATHQSRHESAGIGPLVAELRVACRQDPGFVKARCDFAEALRQHALELRKEMRSLVGERRKNLRAELEKIRTECVDEAESLLRRNDLTPEQRARLLEILGNIRPN